MRKVNITVDLGAFLGQAPPGRAERRKALTFRIKAINQESYKQEWKIQHD
jgi:hypothetical protein